MEGREGSINKQWKCHIVGGRRYGEKRLWLDLSELMEDGVGADIRIRGDYESIHFQRTGRTHGKNTRISTL